MNSIVAALLALLVQVDATEPPPTKPNDLGLYAGAGAAAAVGLYFILQPHSDGSTHRTAPVPEPAPMVGVTLGLLTLRRRRR